MRKRFPKFLATLAISTLLVACQGGSESSSSTPTSDPEPGTSEPTITNTDVVNGGFETGDLSGWNVDGTAFDPGDVSDDTSFGDGVSVDKVGNYAYHGAKQSLPSFVGSMTSDPFVLGGFGMLTMKIGAMADAEKCYVEFFRASDASFSEPLSFKKNGGSETLTRLTNDDYDGYGITTHLIRNVIDLREYLGESIVVRFVDNDRGSTYASSSFVNVDDVRTVRDSADMSALLTEREDQLALLASEPIDQDPPVTELRNGNFESGLDYWMSIRGTAFRYDESLLLEDSEGLYWETRSYFGEGEAFLTTLNVGESLTGTLRSEKFLVEEQEGGGSYAGFLLGAASQSSCYVAVNDADTGTELLTVRNRVFSDPSLAQGMVRYYVDLSEHVGKTLYFTIVDNASSGGFAFIQADDFQINLSESEVVAGIEERRTWSNECPDETAKNAYVRAYSGGISYPIAGEAPRFVHDGDYVYEETRKPGAYDFAGILNAVTVSDDYTATADISLEIVSVTKDGTSFDYENAETIDDGTYLVEISAADAYAQKTRATARIVVDSDAEIARDVVNGGFENGLHGWTSIAGTAFAEADANLLEDSQGSYWGGHYFGEGNAFLTSGKVSESMTGTLASSEFLLEDQGGGKTYASFLLGAGSRSACYVAVNDAATDEELARQSNVMFSDPALAQGMVRYYLDLSEFVGRTVYFTVVDSDSSGGFGFIQADDFKANLSSEEVASSIEEDRAFAETCVDEVPGEAYRNAYNGGVSYPLAGNAPSFALEGGYAYVEERKPGAYDFSSVLRSVKVSDDYTATSAIRLAIESVSRDGSPIEYEGTTDLEEGEYVVELTATDAYDQVGRASARILVSSEATIPNQITNGDFETGDLTGWSVVSGSISESSAVISAETWWAEQVPYNQGGGYHFDGWSAQSDEAATYALRSTEFQLGGSGQISFKMGGKASRLSVYKSDGTLVATYANYMFNDAGVAYPCVSNGSYLATMVTYVADLSDYVGETLYVEIADVAVDGWAVAFFDDIVTYYEESIDISTRHDVVTETNPNTEESRETEIPWCEARSI